MTTAATKKQAKGITLRFIIAVVLFIVILYVFYFIADEIVIEHEGAFDIKIFNALAGIRTDFNTRLMLFFTFFGSTNFLFPVYILLTIYYFFYRKNKKLALDVVTVGLIGTGLLFLLKDIFKRNRPIDPVVHAVGYSFPSGHSFSAFTFFGLMIYLISQTKLQKPLKIIISIIFFLLSAIVATSRVYLHEHYASDVVGGFCLSMMWLILSLWLLHKLDDKIFPPSTAI